MLDLFSRHAAAIAVCLALLTFAARLAAAVARVHRSTHPRLAAAIEALGAASPDPVRFGAQVYEALTGRRVPPLWLALGDVLRLPAPAPSSAPADGPAPRETIAPGDLPSPDETTRAGRLHGPRGALGALCLAALALALGCSGGAAGAAGAALKTATVVIDGAAEVRRYLCHRALDPLLGDPRPAEASTAPSSGGQAPAPRPAPAEVPAPALPPIPVAADPAPRAEGDGGAPDPDAAAPAPAGDGG